VILCNIHHTLASLSTDLGLHQWAGLKLRVFENDNDDDDGNRVWLASFQGFRFQAPNLKYVFLEETN
jgi:hypothetical protein